MSTVSFPIASRSAGRQLSGAFLCWLAVAGPLWAHGSAIDVLVNPQGQLAPYLFPSGIPTPGPAELDYLEAENQIVGSDPGIGVVNEANGLAINTVLRLNVVSPLVLWNGTHFETPRTSLTIQSPDGVGHYVVTSGTDFLTGMKWAVYPGGLFWDEHGRFVMEPNDAPTGIYGVWVELESPSYVTSDPFLYTFIYDPEGTFTRRATEDGVDRVHALGLTRPGDFDQDKQLGAADVNQLTAALHAPYDARFDLDYNGVVDAVDREIWIESLARTFIGDANLDGVFDSSDFVQVLQAGEYEDALAGNSVWETGDWDGDGEFTSGDLVVAFQAAGYEQGPRAAVAAAVPEPSLGIAALLAFALGAFRHQRHKQQ